MQISGGNGQRAGTCLLDRAACIAESRCVDPEIAIAGQQARVAVVQAMRDTDRAGPIAGRDHTSTAIVEVFGDKVDLAGDQLGAAMIGAAQMQVGGAARGDETLGAFEQICPQDQTIAAGLADAACRVVQRAQQQFQLAGIAGNAASAVIELADLPGGCGGTAVIEAAPFIEEGLGLQPKGGREGHAAIAIVELLNLRVGRSLDLQGSTDIAQRRAADLESGHPQDACTVVQAVAGVELEIARALDQATGIVQFACNVQHAGGQW
ncbi:hypothetical protein [Pseudoxanthomonas sp. JBR18]|uniref:hypothetical protein n=1 Tax=Pseudoxanthomonas sp. JBR18 TaxID=2969308 RepID=UPI0023056DC6|nr:hypothetical protein [Pseudoxanthomonas sp. JBR18]WCE05590.1 hypothetical protein PJ250_06460 [Pseudoxanthomonas sp. JBR18]